MNVGIFRILVFFVILLIYVISHAGKDLTGRKRRDNAESDRLHGNASRAVRTREPWLHSYSNDIVHEVRCW
jgi:hypothetical protein